MILVQELGLVGRKGEGRCQMTSRCLHRDVAAGDLHLTSMSDDIVLYTSLMSDDIGDVR